jgi:hypothetical protein
MPSPSREIYGFSHQTASLGAGLHPQVHQCRAGPLEPDGSPFVARTHFMGAAQTASTRCSRRDSKATVSARSALRGCTDIFHTLTGAPLEVPANSARVRLNLIERAFLDEPMLPSVTDHPRECGIAEHPS